MLIAYIDDDEDDKEIFEYALTSLNPSIQLAYFSNCLSFLDYLNGSAEVPDYAFIDLNMPLIGGVECSQMIRKTQRFNDMQIILCSSVISPVTLRLIKNLQCKCFTKPSTVGALAKQIKSTVSI